MALHWNDLAIIMKESMIAKRFVSIVAPLKQLDLLPYSDSPKPIQDIFKNILVHDNPTKAFY